MNGPFNFASDVLVNLSIMILLGRPFKLNELDFFIVNVNIPREVMLQDFSPHFPLGSPGGFLLNQPFQKFVIFCSCATIFKRPCAAVKFMGRSIALFLRNDN